MTNLEIATQVAETKLLWTPARRADITQQVRRIMRIRGMTSKDLAERLGVSEARVSRLLRGRYNLTLDMLYKIADALQEPLTITFGELNVIVV